MFSVDGSCRPWGRGTATWRRGGGRHREAIARMVPRIGAELAGCGSGCRLLSGLGWGGRRCRAPSWRFSHARGSLGALLSLIIVGLSPDTIGAGRRQRKSSWKKSSILTSRSAARSATSCAIRRSRRSPRYRGDRHPPLARSGQDAVVLGLHAERGGRPSRSPISGLAGRRQPHLRGLLRRQMAWADGPD